MDAHNVETTIIEREEPGNQARNLLHQLRQNLSLFSPAERQVGEYVLAQPRQVLRLPTDQLAKEIGVSQGTLSNFSQTLGYSGFKAFRLDLAAEVNAPLRLNHAAIARGDTLQEIANKAISADVDALLTTLRSLDMSNIERAIEAIQQARRIDLYAMGISASVALDAFNRFLGLGLTASWLPDIAHQLGSAALLTSQDVALAFSYAGETRVTVKALSLAHQQGATTIAITGNPRSSLARYADIKLVVTPREPTAFRRNLRISSRIAMLGLVDIIYLGLFNSLDDAALERMESILQLYSRVDESKNDTADVSEP
ncbi:MAG: MurR/RpiR family transcriptional regulator [Chloroflexi bacterium]|nr:MurR/RpiR family transcriptional regulator [Chloroflexota bacterium]